MNKNRLIRTAVLSTIILFLTGCTFDEPVLPSWYIDISIPIPTADFTVEDAVNDSTLIADTTETGIPIIGISVEDSLDRTSISQSDLSFLADQTSFTQSIGDVSLSSPGTQQTDPISASDLVGFPLIAGMVISIPDTVINPPSRILNFSSYAWVVIKNGSLLLTFHNDTFLGIRDSMTIDVFDDSTGNFVGTVLFTDSIPAGSSLDADPLDLGNTSMSNRIRLDFTMPIQALNNYTISTQDANSSATVEATISELSVKNAIAQIPSQQFTADDSVSIMDNADKIRTAKIGRGSVLIELENQLPIGADVQISLLNFYKPDGSQFVKNYQLLPGSIDSQVLNLDGLSMRNFPDDGNVIDYLQFHANVVSQATQGFVQISSEDSVTALIVPDSIFLEEFDGVLDRRELELEPITQTDFVDYAGFQGNLRLEELIMEIKLFNEIGLPIDLNLEIGGAHRDNAGNITIALQLPTISKTIAAGTPGNPSLTLITLSGSDPSPNIVDLMMILPTEITVAGLAAIEGSGTFTVNDGIWAEYRISSPFSVSLTNAIEYKSDITVLTESELDQDVRDSFKNAFGKSSLHLNYSNGLPFGAEIKMHISTDSTDLYSDVIPDSSQKVILDAIDVEPGQTGTTGFVDTPFNGIQDISMNGNQLNIFQNVPLFIGLKVKAKDTQGIVRLRTTDKFMVNGFLVINYLIENE